MKTKTKQVVSERTGRNALRGEVMSGRQSHIYEVGGKIQEQPKPEIRNLIKEIERILGRDGYRRFIQLGFPGEFRASYVKGNRIITISDIPEAYEMQISSVKGIHEAIKGLSIERIKGRRKKQKKNKNVPKKNNSQMKKRNAKNNAQTKKRNAQKRNAQKRNAQKRNAQKRNAQKRNAQMKNSQTKKRNARKRQAQMKNS